jgi:glyoxylase-like metal-dependent hydrolase (beta-lactamase superfamily II)
LNAVPIHADNPGPLTGSGNWTYLVPGASPVLIDAGVGHAAHLDAIAHHVAAGPARVVVTHAHPDHASGAPALGARFPRASFCKWPWPEPDTAIPVPWMPLADGQRLDTDEGPLEVVHTPGHSPDHVILWHAPSRTAFTGDLLVQGSTVVIPASRGGSLAQYLRSLQRLADLAPVRVRPAHGPVIDDPAALIASYVAHRAARETQVLEALSAGCATPAAIASSIYDRLDPALVPMAHESVLAHLVKLSGDGRAICRDDHWSLAG